MDKPIILSNFEIVEERSKEDPLSTTFFRITAQGKGEECNCACPAPSAESIVSISETQPLVRSSALYESPLNEEYKLFFDPSGFGNLAVLNTAAIKVLDAFTSGTSIYNAPQKTPSLLPVDTISAAKQLAALGLLRDLSMHRHESQDSASKILTAWLHLTNECNLRCDYCYIRKTNESMSAEKAQEAVDAIYRSATSQSFGEVKIKYAGGESTMEFALLLKTHDYAQSQAEKLQIKLHAVVLSNGVGLSKSMIRSLQERDIQLAISLDGVGHFHDAQRKFQNGRGSFDAVRRTLERLKDAGSFPTITITVSGRNADGLPQTVAYLLGQEIPFTVNFYRENEHSAQIQDLLYQDQQMIDAMRSAFAIIESNLPKFSLLGTITDRARLNVAHSEPCGVGHSYMVIDQRGNVAKCHMLIEQPVTTVAAVDPLKLLQLDVLGLQNPPVDNKEGCKDCSWKYYCAGGCPALTYRVTGRYDVKSPNCRIYTSLFPEVLRLEGLRLLKQANVLC